VPWDLDAAFRMPATVWRAAMDQFFPGGGWIRLDRATIDRLQAFRGRHAVVTFDEAVELLLQSAAEDEAAGRAPAPVDEATERQRQGRVEDIAARGRP
jgi:hypothetical protein